MLKKMLDIIEDEHVPFSTAAIFGQTIIGIDPYYWLHKIQEEIPDIEKYKVGVGQNENGNLQWYFAFSN